MEEVTEQGRMLRDRGLAERGSHDALAGPEDGVVMEVVGGVEGEVVALLPAGVRAAVAVDVGLHPPLAAADVAQELEVQLVVRLLVHVAVRQLRDKQGRRNPSLFFRQHLMAGREMDVSVSVVART
jgi:hypothetical protein